MSTLTRTGTGPVVAAGALALVLGAAVLSGSPLAFAALAAVPLTVAAFARPVLALAAMAAFVPLEGFASLVPGAFTLPRLIGVVAFACYLVNALAYRRGVAVNPSARWFGAFVFWSFLSGFWAADAGGAYTMVFVVFQLWLLYVMTANLAAAAPALRLVLAAYVLGSVVASAWAMRNYATHSYATNLERVSAVDDMNPNDFARMVGFGLLAALHLAFETPSRWLKQAALAAAPVLFAGLVLSKGRGAWMALAAALAALFFFAKKSPRAYAAALLVTLLLAATVAAGFRLGYFDDGLRARLEDTAEGKDPTAQRADIWKVGLALFAANPVVGVGFDNFHVRFNDYLGRVHTDVFPGFNKDPHNVLLSVAGETGLVGLGLFTAALFAVGRRLARAPPGLARAFGAAYVVFALVAGFSGTDHIRKWYWLAWVTALLLAQREGHADSGRQPNVSAA